MTVNTLAIAANGTVSARLAATCTAQSTSFTLRATDTGELADDDTVTVTVTPETTPPTLTCPSTQQTTNATSAAGAIVSFTPTATDNCTTTPTITCTPASGTRFASGNTSVSCTAKDSANNTTVPCTFTVTVTGASGQITTLRSTVNTLAGVQAGIKNSLMAKLTGAQAALSAGNTATACARMQDFLNEVKAQAGKKLTAAQANQLISAATQIRTVLGCV